MTEDAQSLALRVQEGTVKGDRNFLGATLGRLRDQLAGDRSQLEDLEREIYHQDTRARIRELIDACSTIEASIAETARNLGLEEKATETPGRSRHAEARDEGAMPGEGGQEAPSGMQDTAGAVGNVVGAAGQVPDEAVSQAAQVAGQVGQLAENLPGGKLLGRTTDGAGRTVQRVAYGSGDIIQTTLDESDELLDENLVGNLADLPPEEESTTQEGHTLRTVRDESGALVKLEFGPDGDFLDLEILPDS